ncbi:hypothetical protein ATK78_2602 [Pedobacter metabolipauper]|uniref:Uncharacterized protein n=1 Tax=Pedobacter metabolipauper TaxID=425513 RepID=A0A4R6STL7_9SPHI|nr:hypothetical protein ATK78_2602 [Pedobacter metabolipauper]
MLFQSNKSNVKSSDDKILFRVKQTDIDKCQKLQTITLLFKINILSVSYICDTKPLNKLNQVLMRTSDFPDP